MHLISGRDDGGVNRIASPPVGGGQDATALSSRVHGLDEPVHYLVFELHGRHSTSGRIDDRTVGERVRRLIREPHRLKYALGAGARTLRGAVRRR